MPDLSSFLGASVAGYSLGKVLSALATLLVCLIAVKLIMKLLTRLLSRTQKLGDRLQGLLLTAVKVILYVLTLIITAEALGFNTSSLTALLSVLTLGVTLAAEDILGNVAGGLVILSSRPFALGDYIEAGGVSGTVREIGLNRVKLETPDAEQGALRLQDHQLYRAGPPPGGADGHSLLRCPYRGSEGRLYGGGGGSGGCAFRPGAHRAADELRRQRH